MGIWIFFRRSFLRLQASIFGRKASIDFRERPSQTLLSWRLLVWTAYQGISRQPPASQGKGVGYRVSGIGCKAGTLNSITLPLRFHFSVTDEPGIDDDIPAFAGYPPDRERDGLVDGFHGKIPDGVGSLAEDLRGGDDDQPVGKTLPDE